MQQIFYTKKQVGTQKLCDLYYLTGSGWHCHFLEVNSGNCNHSRNTKLICKINRTPANFDTSLSARYCKRQVPMYLEFFMLLYLGSVSKVSIYRVFRKYLITAIGIMYASFNVWGDRSFFFSLQNLAEVTSPFTYLLSSVNPCTVFIFSFTREKKS